MKYYARHIRHDELDKVRPIDPSRFRQLPFWPYWGWGGSTYFLRRWGFSLNEGVFPAVSLWWGLGGLSLYIALAPRFRFDLAWWWRR